MIRSPRLSIGLLAALITGTLYALSRDIGPVGPLSLIAPIALLIYALSTSRIWHVALCAFLARLISFAGIVYAYGGTLPVGILTVAGLSFAFEFALVVLLTRWCALRLPTWAGVFSFPVLTTASEFLFLYAAPNGSFGSLGYSIIDILPLAQAASLGGVAALTFIAALVPMILTLALHRRAEWRQAVFAGAIPLVAIGAYGLWRLSLPYEQTIRVGLASIDALTVRALKSPADAAEVARLYAQQVHSFEGANVDIVVLPERVFADLEGEIGDGSEPLQAVSEALDVRLVAGFTETLKDTRQANTARMFTPEGLMHRYSKRKMIPDLESHLVPGQSSLLVGNVGIAICKDLDFAPMIREYGQHGASLLLIPAWDFKRDGRMHARMAVLRGIENGFALARAAASGRLTVSDGFGRIVAEKATSDEVPVTLISDVGLTSRATVYSRLGDAFAWLVVAVAAAMLAACLISSKPKASLLVRPHGI